MRPTRTETLALPDGPEVAVGVIEHVFSPWSGAAPPRSYGTKPVVDGDGCGVFAEIAIVRLLNGEGWHAVWASTYGGVRYFDEQPTEDRSNVAEIPRHIQEAVDQIAAVNGTTAGMFDVIAWKDDQTRFLEAKRRRRDRIRDTQRRWLSAALSAGYPAEAFLLCEWDYKNQDSGP